jgi:hypothetical protein
LSRCWNISAIRFRFSHSARLLKVREAQLKLELVKLLQQLAAVELRIDAGERTFAGSFGFGDLK